MELTGATGLRIDGALAVITLSRPEQRNTLTYESIVLFRDQLLEAFSRAEVRAVLIRAVGKTFCAGMDLAELTARGAPSRREFLDAVEEFNALLALISSGPKPIVAAVTGDLFAGGVGLVGACDLVYSLESIGVQLGELVFGLIPANIANVLVDRRIPLSRFRRLALTAEPVSAAEAREMGLFDEIYDDRRLLEKGLRRRFKQLFRLSPEAIRRFKALLALRGAAPPAAFLPAAGAALVDLAADPATIEAIEAIGNGEPPAWFEKFRPAAPLVLEE